MRLLGVRSRFGSVCPSARPRVASVGLPTGRRCARSTRRAKGRVQWVRRARLPATRSADSTAVFRPKDFPDSPKELRRVPGAHRRIVIWMTTAMSLRPPTRTSTTSGRRSRRARRGRRRFSTRGIPRAGRAPPRAAAAAVEDDAEDADEAAGAGAARPRARARGRSPGDARRGRGAPTPKTAPTRPPGGVRRLNRGRRTETHATRLFCSAVT